MPFFDIFTNLPRSKFNSGLISQLVNILSKNMDKAPDRFRVLVLADQYVNIQGSEEPGLLMKLSSIGKISEEINTANTKQIMELLTNELGVPPIRQSIIFTDVRGENIGCNSQTLKHLNP